MTQPRADRKDQAALAYKQSINDEKNGLALQLRFSIKNNLFNSPKQRRTLNLHTFGQGRKAFRPSERWRFIGCPARQRYQIIRRTKCARYAARVAGWEEKTSSRNPTNRKHGRFALAEFFVAR